MRRSALALALVLAATPALAQPARPAIPSAPLIAPSQPTPVAKAKALIGGMTVHQSVALGASLFIGAMAGSALVGGSIGTIIGGASGLLIGNWWYASYRDDDDS